MNNMLQLGSIVQLVTFNGEKFASKKVGATEDFGSWLVLLER